MKCFFLKLFAIHFVHQIIFFEKNWTTGQARFYDDDDFGVFFLNSIYLIPDDDYHVIFN